ncbi:MAG: ABC transporter permease [Bacilli bacterium]|nr:ABC transporter permease [Bacilli bacterium]
MATAAKKQRRFNFRGSLCMPFAVFMLLFVIFPLCLIVYFAFTDSSGHLYLDNWGKIFTDSTKWLVIGRTFLIAFLTTVFCILIAYPIAFILSNGDRRIRKNKILVYIFILPMWVNFVLRTMALRDMVNWFTSTLFNFQLTSTHPLVGVVVGMVYDYLPFAILPLYNQMIKMDKSQIEAAADLGANPVQVFIKTIIPMTIPGIISACTMTFMPTMSSYVIAYYMGNGKMSIIGTEIEAYAGSGTQGYNPASILSLVMLFIIGLSIFAEKLFDKKGETREGGIW